MSTMLAGRDAGGFARLLQAAGISDGEAAAKGALFAKCAASLEELAGRETPSLRGWFVPGRIEALGKHTDYAGGRSLLCAVEKGFCVLASPREDNVLRIVDAADGSRIEFAIEPRLEPTPGGWDNYPKTVARRLARNFGLLQGADIALASDLPRAAGMSSSSALVVAIYLVLADRNKLAGRPEYGANIHRPEDLVGYLGTIENGQTFGALAGDAGVGTFGGSEDHTAILLCQSGQFAQYSFGPVAFERSVPMPANQVLVVGVSGVTAEKTGAARELYNRVSLSAAAAIHIWRQTTGREDPHLASAVRAGAVDRLRQVLAHASHPAFTPNQLLDRVEQFVAESEQIIPAASAALAEGRLHEFGQLVDRSQALSETQLGNQVPQTIFLSRSARELGATAASAFGAGFGGSVWAMVAANQAEKFAQQWAQRYAKEYPSIGVPSVFVTRPASGAVAL